jgi:hypothetical protein
MVARGAWIPACLALVLMAATAFSTGCGGGVTNSTIITQQLTSSSTVSLTIK